MLNELKKLKDLLINWFILFLFGGLFFFLFGITTIDFFGHIISVPLPITNSFSIQLFKMMQSDLLPQGVNLVAMGPLSALNTQTIIAFALSFIFTFPFLIYKLTKYISPALYKTERHIFSIVLFCVMFLFLGGCIFSYKFVIPPTFHALYSYTTNTGVISIFAMESFVYTVVTFMMISGILFLLPIFMVLLSFLNIVPASFWKNNWRYAQMTFLVFSAIITPDGSGVSMILLSLPLTVLYVVGVIVTSMKKKSNY
jgi:sec-independent protein translocase protein TatC